MLYSKNSCSLLISSGSTTNCCTTSAVLPPIAAINTMITGTAIAILVLFFSRAKLKANAEMNVTTHSIL